MDTLNAYCSCESDIRQVSRYTGEEYHLWLERKVRQAKKLNDQAQKK